MRVQAPEVNHLYPGTITSASVSASASARLAELPAALLVPPQLAGRQRGPQPVLMLRVRRQPRVLLGLEGPQPLESLGDDREDEVRVLRGQLGAGGDGALGNQSRGGFRTVFFFVVVVGVVAVVGFVFFLLLLGRVARSFRGLFLAHAEGVVLLHLLKAF